jgi:hypothetical protein
MIQAASQVATSGPHLITGLEILNMVIQGLIIGPCLAIGNMGVMYGFFTLLKKIKENKEKAVVEIL